MKKISFLLMITASLFFFNSCEDENDVTINYTSFETTSMDFGVELDGSSTNDITIYSTKTSGSARTFNINVLSASTADPASYDVPASVTIPANSNMGTFPVTISDLNIGENGETLILDLPEENGVYTGAPLTLKVKQVCPLNEVILTITFDAYPDETSWELLDSSEAVVDSGDSYDGQTSFTKAFCLENGTYTFIIYDVYEDGINAPGNYKLTYNGTTIASGSAFGASDSTTFEVSK
jgi:hypothetical protein